MNGADILEAVAAAAPTLRENVGTADEARRLPDAAVEAMRAAGVFRMAMPKAWGGPECSLWTQVEIVEALARVDGALGWYAMIGSDGGFYSAFLDDEVGRELWPDLDIVTAGFITPAGSAVVDGDDYIVSGRWTFGSAGIHSRWLASGCLVLDDGQLRMTDNGLPDMIVALLPTEACEIHETWNTLGLRGTASHDYSADGVRVPSQRTFRLLSSTPRRSGAIYGAANLFLTNMAGVPLGLARHAIDELRHLALTKRTLTGAPLFESSEVLAAVARAEMMLGAARAFVKETVDDVESTLDRGEELSDVQRARFRGCLIYAAETGRDVALLALRTSGGSGVYEKNPFERITRDALTALQHTVFSTAVVEDCGRLWLGQRPHAPLM